MGSQVFSSSLYDNLYSRCTALHQRNIERFEESHDLQALKQIAESILLSLQVDEKHMEVVIADANNCKKTIYYSPVYFQPVKGKKVLSTVIAPIDNTGYRCSPGVSVNIFDTREECVKCYREQVRQADEIYEKEKARIIKEFDARMQILNDSLTPFNDVPQSDYTVTVKADATNNDLPYSAKDRGYRYEVSKSMTPEKYAIEKFKSCVLRDLADELRANTQWKRGAPISLTFVMDIYVDGMRDITQTEMMPLTLTL